MDRRAVVRFSRPVSNGARREGHPLRRSDERPGFVSGGRKAVKRLYPDLWRTAEEKQFGVLTVHAYLLERPGGNVLFYNPRSTVDFEEISERTRRNRASLPEPLPRSG